MYVCMYAVYTVKVTVVMSQYEHSAYSYVFS